MSERSDAISPSSSTDIFAGTLQAHLAEYNALTMRMTYWIAIQYAVYGLMVAYLAFAVQLSNDVTLVTLVWASMCALQVLGWGILHTEGEIFSYVEYIEIHLKPRVRDLVIDSHIWGFEPFLAGQRKDGFINFEWNWAAPILFFCVELIAIFLVYYLLKESTWYWGDTAWTLINLFLGTLLGFKFSANAKTKRRVRRSIA